MSEIAEQLALVVEGLVDEPDLVEVHEEEDGDTVILTVEVGSDEVGRVIGRQGRTVKALRTLLELRGADDDVFYELEVED